MKMITNRRIGYRSFCVILSVMMCTSLYFSDISISNAAESSESDVSVPSEWALNEVNMAIANGLVKADSNYQYKMPITRLEFEI